MSRWPVLGSALLIAALLQAGCATRSRDVEAAVIDRAEFAVWPCERIQDEISSVQQRAADVAYDVDQRASNNIVALGVGLAVFWPALLAMRPDGLEAADLAQLKGRFEALRSAERQRGCPTLSAELPPGRVAALPIAVGERLIYQERVGSQGPLHERALRVDALRRDEVELVADAVPGQPAGAWRQDGAGNLRSAPDGMLMWQRLLKRGLVLGQVVGGEITRAGDTSVRARVRGQVVAVGPQSIAGHSFDAAVIELFGDAIRLDTSTRLDGVIVVDRASGVLLRLELQSSMPPFALERRLTRVETRPQ